MLHGSFLWIMFSLGHQAQLFEQQVKDRDKNELPITGRFK